MITIDTVKGFIKALVGDRGIKMLSDAEWLEFSQYGKDIVEIHNESMDAISLSGGNIDLNALKIKHAEFNQMTARFVERLSFGVDQNGQKVTFEKLFSGAFSPHPMSMISLCMKFICLWAVEHKINMKYREKYENHKPKYKTAQIKNNAPLPQN